MYIQYIFIYTYTDTHICMYTIHTYIHIYINILNNVALAIELLDPAYFWDLFLMGLAINFIT